MSSKDGTANMSVKSCGACRSARATCGALLLATATLLVPRTLAAQEPTPSSPSPVAGGLRRAALDPTTYGPALLAYHATIGDWNSSQPLFAHGFHERNPRFTVTGLPNDRPVSYTVGRRQILSDTLAVFGASLANNLSTGAIEYLMIERFPRHRRIVRALGWIERASFASYWSYRLSMPHYRQTAENVAAARALGYR